MLLVGLIGGIGAGKTYVANNFKELNVPVIIADQIAKDLLYTDQNVILRVKIILKLMT